MDDDFIDETVDYYRFTTKQRLEVAVHSLQGMVQGIVADGKVNDQEVAQLISWVSRHKEFSDRHPFNELIPAIQTIVADGIVDEDEQADLLWLCKKLSSQSSFYDNVTAELQELQGFLAGIISDGVVTEEELAACQAWLDSHEHLRTCWPYDEIDSLIMAVMADGKIDSEEQEQLLAFFGQFVNAPGHNAISKIDDQPLVTGVCAACPEITFDSRVFCFTGTSERGPRSYLAEIVEERGGVFNKCLRNDTSYLVIGAAGNPCWAYACYGRKVEEAVNRRKAGQNIVLVHEYDFWDETGL